MSETGLSKSHTLDIYRKTCLRYLGYLGLFEKYISLLPRTVARTIATTYIVADVTDKSVEANNQGKSKCELFVTASDAIIWQTASSILIPGLLMKSISDNVKKLKLNRKLVSFSAVALPYVLCFAIIPFLSEPIDKSVNFLMNNSYRKLLNGNLTTCSQVNALKMENQNYIWSEDNKFGDFDKIYEELKIVVPNKQPKQKKVENTENSSKKGQNEKQKKKKNGNK